ncbi:MAG TPA: NADH-quinone oxidoreductase subunit N [Armatimonadota bacterium]|nr:NADH-quinone oxidoreductase subunit N [Armatimonadota bacterium]
MPPISTNPIPGAGSFVNWMAIAPEMALWFFACVALLIEWTGRPRDPEREAPGFLSAEMMSALGLFIALLLVLAQASGAFPHPAFRGTIVMDPLAWFYKGACVLTSLILMPSSWRYMRRRQNRPEFYALFLLATSGMLLMVESNDLIMLFLSIEFLSITSYVLVGYLKGSRRSTEAAIKYFLFGSICSALMLYGMSLLYALTGSTKYEIVGARLPGVLPGVPTGIFVLMMVMFFAGIGFKISMWPFHMWAPDAYEGAPTPVTAFLSVGPKLAGIAVFVRVVQTMFRLEPDWPTVLAIVAVITMTWGNLAALGQNNVKRMLAYSSIAQAGYLLVGVVALSSISLSNAVMAAGASSAVTYGFQYALPAVLVYSAAYLIMNLGAFIVAIEVEGETGTSNLQGFAGLGEKKPAMAAAMTIFLLGLGGIPLTVGFIGKMYLFGAAVSAGVYTHSGPLWTLAGFGVANSVISIYYYFKIVHPMWIQSGDDKSYASWGAIEALVLFLAVLTIGFGVFGQGVIIPSDQSQTVYSGSSVVKPPSIGAPAAAVARLPLPVTAGPRLAAAPRTAAPTGP